jgi:sugar/nucleoside kinase (ribokinase family)
MYDLIVVGYLTQDTIESPYGIHVFPGGTATYTSIVASRLGLRVGIVSRVGRDLKGEYLDLLEGEGVDLEGLHMGDTANTTSFTNRYGRSGSREQFLTQLCEEIQAEDIPNSYLDARCFHFGPIFHEIPYSVVEKVKDRSILTSLDLQGYCRRVVEGGRILPSPPGEGERRVISYMDVVKGSGEEVSLTAGMGRAEEALEGIGEGARIVIATLAERGSLLHHKGVLRRIPPYPPDRILDPTGSGDAFTAGFLVKYLESGDPYASALYASCVASFILEEPGFKRAPTREMVEERMRRGPPSASPYRWM